MTLHDAASRFCRTSSLVTLFASLVCGVPVMAADEDKELDLIPDAAQTAPAAADIVTPTPAQRNYLENALTGAAPRHGLVVPYPSPTPPSWEDRLFLDSQDVWRLTDGLTFTYSGRFNLRAENSVTFPSHENVRNDLREAFLSWEPVDDLWLDLGRINVKNGVAVGFNPTDFFRTRAVVEPLTADPSVLREDRLGTLMLLGQRVWDGGSIMATFAPQVTLPTRLYDNIDLPSFDPMLDRTNAQDRTLLKASLDIANGLNPELLLYHAGTRTQVGTNLTIAIGQSTIFYTEWSGGVRGSLINDALTYGKETRTIPAQARPVVPDDPAQYFRNDLAIGFSYSTEVKVTFNLEYHYHQAGFSAQDWSNWFAAGARPGTSERVLSTLWYIRSYAQDQQEPMSQHSAFFRTSWTDAFVTDLQLSALAIVDLEDRSVLAQATADYYLSRNWTIGALASFTFGGQRTEFGSLPQAGSALLHLIRYF